MRDTGPHPLAVAALAARSVAAREPLSRAAGDPWAEGELARVIAVQNLRPEDWSEALTLLDGLRERGGITGVHQGLHCQLAYATGDPAQAEALLAEYPDVPAPVRAALAVDLGRADLATLLPAPKVQVPDGPGRPFDRLTTGPVQRRGHDRRITSVVTTWQPGPELLTAVRSLTRQTWTNHEILVVDDGSSTEFAPVLRAAAALDPRVRVIRMVARAGPYVARNAGLDAATGDFVTFPEPDGWSHPLRLERQVAPLLADERLFSTTAAALPVTPGLVVTRPGLDPATPPGPASLMLRRAVALSRVGHFDPVRAGAAHEYAERAQAVLGPAATMPVNGLPLALTRLGPDDTDAPRAYVSAFRRWHAHVRDGREPATRPRAFAVPRRLRGETGARAYDVVLAGDWTTAGGAGTAGIGQLRALAARRQRAALLHLDALPHLREGPRDLDPAVQDLINTGELTEIGLADDARARLVVARSAHVLQYAPDQPSGVRAQRVLIEDAVVVPAAATAAKRLFGQWPLWTPAGPDGRRQLSAETGVTVAGLDLPSTLDAAQWRLDRRGPRADRPVVGRHCRGGPAEWRRLRDEVPESARLDVRLLDAAGSADRSFGRFGPPRSWLVYGPGDVSLRSFLGQIDFYLHLPPDDEPADPGPDLLTALAAGCVAVLPYRYAAAFGDAAVYCTPEEVPDTVRRLHANRRALRDQSARGAAYVRRHHTHALYAERVSHLAHPTINRTEGNSSVTSWHLANRQPGPGATDS
ncbi:glycosyltransferase [Actinoplanes sp. TRM 88003]|uniref:Glycosyltransferase n=1 Tax=Paractinoplanes aksuensis TaxID=2939490 RepID=A0ABT1DM87_9ACTN|nr:glycosyltransferase family 2 protein [Actinoplanes aksuensis]MCO8271944.1 glycosyltransferase [Actinoplanes aksuensis]